MPMLELQSRGPAGLLKPETVTSSPPWVKVPPAGGSILSSLVDCVSVWHVGVSGTRGGWTFSVVGGGARESGGVLGQVAFSAIIPRLWLKSYARETTNATRPSRGPQFPC